MHSSSLENFKIELNQIREYLKHIEYVTNIVADFSFENDAISIANSLIDFKEHYKKNHRDKKVFEYKSIVISLYGLLERYVETWIKEYLDFLSVTITDYNEIDEKLRNNHFKLSIQLITMITSRDSAKYEHIVKEDILKRLNECITHIKPYKLNSDAFTISSGNVKHNKIVELFALIGIKLNEELKRNMTFNEYLKRYLDTEHISNLETENLYSRINDLVDRRNDIAHGVSITNTVGQDELLDYCSFLENYCMALFDILTEKSIEQESIHKFEKIEVIHKVINNSILGFELSNYFIKVGDFVIVETSDNHFYKKAILSLQKNRESYNELQVQEKTDIGIGLEPTINNNCTFYLPKK